MTSTLDSLERRVSYLEPILRQRLTAEEDKLNELYARRQAKLEYYRMQYEEQHHQQEQQQQQQVVHNAKDGYDEID